MDIGSIGNTYLSNMQSTAEKASNKIDSTLKSDLTGASDAELMEVCKEFEAYFIEQVFKNMKSTLPESEEGSGATSTLVDYFEDSLYQEYAKSASDQGNYGIAQTLYEQMKRNYGTAIEDTDV